jgi:hypothetical protein
MGGRHRREITTRRPGVGSTGWLASVFNHGIQEKDRRGKEHDVVVKIKEIEADSVRSLSHISVSRLSRVERQLQDIEPSSKREIIEGALEPWLRANGYLL